MRIALLEDDIDQARIVDLWLSDAGHTCQHFETGKSFIKGIINDSFDLLILDWMLPDMNGDQVLEWVRNNIDWHIPVLFVTMRDTETDIVHALEAGADDYMTKPVKQMELLARINALGRRCIPQDDQKQTLEVPPFALDPITRSVVRNGENIEMTHKEFDLAMFLFRNIGRIMSRGHILESVWGRNPDINTRTVDTHISRLRNKLGLSKENGWRLSAIYQHGYRLEKLDSNTDLDSQPLH